MDIENRIKNYWDERSEDFSKFRRIELEGVSSGAWEKILTADLPASNSLKILDVGTGAGFFAEILSKFEHKVTGVDLSPKMIDAAEKLLNNIKLDAKFFVADAQNLPFDNATFDAIVTRNLTWTLPMKAYRE